MKKITTLMISVLIAACAFAPNTFAASNCSYVVQDTVINIEGWAIDFREPLDQAVQAHHYTATSDLREAEYQLSLSYQQLNSGFLNKAQVQLHWLNLKTGAVKDFQVMNKTCLTQLCSIYDFRGAAQKAIRDLKTKLPDCGSTQSARF